VRTTDARYDVIIADNFHPARSGSGALYTVEHFLSVRERLEPGGFFCQWLPLHQLDLDTLRSIVQSFLAAFPRGGALLASNSLETPVIGLVGRADDAGFDADAVDARVRDVALPTPVRGMGLLDSFDVLGSFVAGPSALRHFAGGSARNTDDRPVVAYRAPRVTYAPDSLPRDRLVALLRDVSPAYDELLAPGDARGFRPRLSAYWRARDAFILAGLRVRPASDVATMLAQVRDPLLGVLAMSADFRPAYEPLLQMALAEAGTDPHAARELLGALARLQPARPEAPRALHELAASGP
jgi:spermidine synthase